MPIKLHVHAAGPLDDGVDTYWIAKRRDHDIGARLTRSGDCGVHIGDQIAVAFITEVGWDGRRKSEERHGADGSLQQLRSSLAGSWRNGNKNRLRAGSSEAAEEASYKAVNVGGSDVNVRGVILRRDRW